MPGAETVKLLLHTNRVSENDSCPAPSQVSWAPPDTWAALQGPSSRPWQPAPALLCPHSAHSSPHQSLLSSHPHLHWHFMKLLRASLVVQLVKKVKSEVKVKSLSRVRLFVTPWTAAHQASQSMGFSRQEYWSGLPFPSAGDLPDLGSHLSLPCLLHYQADSLPLSYMGSPTAAEVSCHFIRETLRKYIPDQTAQTAICELSFISLQWDKPRN